MCEPLHAAPQPGRRPQTSNETGPRRFKANPLPATDAPPAPACPPPPLPSFVLTGNWVGARIPVQKRHVLPNGNIVYAIQGGQYVKMVVTDRNNLPITARYYEGSINDLNTRTSDMVKINSLGDAAGNYVLSSAP